MFECVVASLLTLQRFYVFRYQVPPFYKFDEPSLSLPRELAHDCCPHINLVCRTRHCWCTYILQRAAEMQRTIFNSLLQCLSSSPFSLPSQLAGTPSPVRNLTVLVDFDVTKSKIFANLSWVGPERPYGKLDHYQIVLSSAKTVSLIGSTTRDVKVYSRANTHTAT